jgi:hypothetical protein
MRWCREDALFRGEYLAMIARNGGKLVPMILHVLQTGEPFDLKQVELEETSPKEPRAGEFAILLRRSVRFVTDHTCVLNWHPATSEAMLARSP